MFLEYRNPSKKSRPILGNKNILRKNTSLEK